MSSWHRMRTSYAGHGATMGLVGLVLLAALGPTSPASAQKNSGGDFSGALKDATGRLLSNVPIVLANIETGEKVNGQSDASGRFTFAGVPAGEYQIQVRRAGFVSKQGRVTLALGRKVQQDMTLQLGTLQETVVIRLSAGEPIGTARPERLAASPPAAVPCTPTASSDCIIAPTKLVNMRPAYPTGQAQRRESGRVSVEARIGTNGRLENLRTEAGADQAFVDAVLGALRQWQYSPARLNGVPVTCEIVVVATFQASGDVGA